MLIRSAGAIFCARRAVDAKKKFQSPESFRVDARHTLVCLFAMATSSVWQLHSAAVRSAQIINARGLRDVFAEHTKYTALFICAAIDGTPAVPALSKRLMTDNSLQIADSVAALINMQKHSRPLQDQVATLRNALNAAFREHIAGAAAIVSALPQAADKQRGSSDMATSIQAAVAEMLRGDGVLFQAQKPLASVIKRTGRAFKGSERLVWPGFDVSGASLQSKIGAWYANAEKIVKLLAKNPFVFENEQGDTEDLLRAMFYEHLDQTLIEAAAYYFVSLPGGGAKWIAAVDTASYHMLEMADVFIDIFLHD